MTCRSDGRKLHHLQVALGTRDLIGQAKGILMERYEVTPEQAFAMLARLGQDTNRQLHEVAEYLTTTGVMAPSGRRAGSGDGPPP